MDVSTALPIEQQMTCKADECACERGTLNIAADKCIIYIYYIYKCVCRLPTEQQLSVVCDNYVTNKANIHVSTHQTFTTRPNAILG